jgi:hypothetical protein
MYFPFYTKTFNLIIPLVPILLSTQFFLRSKIKNYDPNIYEPYN